MPDPPPDRPDERSLRAALAAAEREALRVALGSSGGNRARAARLLDVSPKHVRALLARWPDVAAEFPPRNGRPPGA